MYIPVTYLRGGMNGDQFLIVNSHLEILEGVILPHNKLVFS